MTFSKWIIFAVMMTYFAGVAIGAIVVLNATPEMLGEYLIFLGAPTVTAIGFYTWKAKAENVLKIKDNVKMNKEQAIDFLKENLK